MNFRISRLKILFYDIKIKSLFDLYKYSISNLFVLVFSLYLLAKQMIERQQIGKVTD